jgi:hypothetical protein
METVRALRRAHTAGRLVGLGLACLLALSAAPVPAAAATKTYTLDLGARSDFVAQKNIVQCVGASMQMMLNMIRPGADHTAATQLKLQKLARQGSPQRTDGTERKGASVIGWSAGLNLLGAGPYKVVGTATIDEALLIAAQAMRKTGKPVGLLVWRGRHAWVMSGFKATGDPLNAGSRVTAAIVEDPLYPHNSSVWGRSPAPGAALSVTDLGRQFVPRRQSSNLLGLGGKYVVVVPYEYDVPLRRLMWFERRAILKDPEPTGRGALSVF